MLLLKEWCVMHCMTLQYFSSLYNCDFMTFIFLLLWHLLPAENYMFKVSRKNVKMKPTALHIFGWIWTSNYLIRHWKKRYTYLLYYFRFAKRFCKVWTSEKPFLMMLVFFFYSYAWSPTFTVFIHYIYYYCCQRGNIIVIE